MGLQAVKLDQNLKTYLQKSKISQKDLAEKAKINHSSLHNYLYGQVPKSLQNIINIATSLNIGVDELLFESTKG